MPKCVVCGDEFDPEAEDMRSSPIGPVHEDCLPWEELEDDDVPDPTTAV